MDKFDFQIVVQWNSRKDGYEAYCPTLSIFAARFAPDFPRSAHGDSMSEALENAVIQSKNLLRELKKLAIPPPPPDTGPTDPVGYVEREDLGEMVL